MEPRVFADESVKPNDELIFSIIGEKELLWKQIMSYLFDNHTDISGTWKGEVSRISDSIDSKTRTLKVFISISGKNLKEGMYLKGDIVSDLAVNTVEIPRKLLIDQNSVMVVNKSKIDLMPIKVIQYKDETVLVEGLSNGTQLLLKTSGLSRGMHVRVQKVKP